RRPPVEAARRNPPASRFFRGILQPGREANAIDGPAGAAPANAHVQITRLRMDHGAGRRKAVVADGLEKDLGSSDVASTRALQRHEPDAAKSPVEQEEAAAKALGKLSVPVANDPRRRATAKRRHRRSHVDE